MLNITLPFGCNLPQEMLTIEDVRYKLCASSIRFDFEIEEFSYYEEFHINAFLHTLEEIGLVKSFRMILNQKRTEILFHFSVDGRYTKHESISLKKVDFLIDSVSMS